MTSRIIFTKQKKKKRQMGTLNSTLRKLIITLIVISSGFDAQLYIHNVKTQKLLKKTDLNLIFVEHLKEEDKLRCPPYIYSMCNIGNSLFLTTETGHIARFNIKQGCKVTSFGFYLNMSFYK